MHSQCLYDEGEERWPLKLHVGCGGVYLTDSGTGYQNYDIEGKFASEYPELREQNATSISNYYARLDGDMQHLPMRRETVADCLLDLSIGLPFLPETVDKIVAIQVFEHFTPACASMVVRGWNEILKTGRPLVMSVPDIDGTLDMIQWEAEHESFDGKTEFALRHLRGRQGDWINSHHTWWQQDTLIELLQEHGFRCQLLPNIHFYPAVVVRGIKI